MIKLYFILNLLQCCNSPGIINVSLRASVVLGWSCSEVKLKHTMVHRYKWYGQIEIEISMSVVVSEHGCHKSHFKSPTTQAITVLIDRL